MGHSDGHLSFMANFGFHYFCIGGIQKSRKPKSAVKDTRPPENTSRRAIAMRVCVFPFYMYDMTYPTLIFHSGKTTFELIHCTQFNCAACLCCMFLLIRNAFILSV